MPKLVDESRTFNELLADHKLTARLLNYIKSSIALSDENTTAIQVTIVDINDLHFIVIVENPSFPRLFSLIIHLCTLYSIT